MGGGDYARQQGGGQVIFYQKLSLCLEDGRCWMCTAMLLVSRLGAFGAADVRLLHMRGMNFMLLREKSIHHEYY